METCCSTSSADAPGMRTKTSASGTTICGSSSRGVRARAAAPAASMTRMRRTDRLPWRNASTTRETKPWSVRVAVIAAQLGGRGRPAAGRATRSPAASPDRTSTFPSDRRPDADEPPASACRPGWPPRPDRVARLAGPRPAGRTAGRPCRPGCSTRPNMPGQERLRGRGRRQRRPSPARTRLACWACGTTSRTVARGVDPGRVDLDAELLADRRRPGPGSPGRRRAVPGRPGRRRSGAACPGRPRRPGRRTGRRRARPGPGRDLGVGELDVEPGDRSLARVTWASPTRNGPGEPLEVLAR